MTATSILHNRPLRLSISLCAVVSAIVLCDSLKHFRIVSSDPSTYDAISEHRCGWILLITIAWALTEAAISTRHITQLERQA